MSHWTDGYVSDIQYTSEYYRELSPLLLSVCVQSQGRRAPDPARPFTYCELACGQGYGTNLLAATYPHARFWGFDFNPGQIANARRLAEQAQLTNVEFYDESFESLVSGTTLDIPQFDYVALHGIYSWVSEQNRHYIVDFLDRYVKPGGIVYISYNAMPGWAASTPLQRLIRDHAGQFPNRSDRQAMSAIEFSNELLAADALYFARNPVVGDRLKQLPSQNHQYLAHEYLNGHWHPLYHADVVQELDRAKLSFAASAYMFNNIDVTRAPENVRALASRFTDPVFQESIKDFGNNEQFRRDIFVKGNSLMTLGERFDWMARLKIVASADRRHMSCSFPTPSGTAEGAADIYIPIFDMLGDGKAVSVNAMGGLTGLGQSKINKIINALLMCIGAGYAHPSTSESVDKDVAQRFNKTVLDEVVRGAGYSSVSAPVAGTGFYVTTTDVLTLHALSKHGDLSPDQLLAPVWQLMQITGRKVMKDGVHLDQFHAAKDRLFQDVTAFVEQKLPLLKRLGAI